MRYNIIIIQSILCFWNLFIQTVVFPIWNSETSSLEMILNRANIPDSVYTVLFSSICSEGPGGAQSCLKILFPAAADHSGFLPSDVLQPHGLVCVRWGPTTEVWLSGTEDRPCNERGDPETATWAWPSMESQRGGRIFFSSSSVALPLLKMLCRDCLCKVPRLHSSNFMLTVYRSKKGGKIWLHTCARVFVRDWYSSSWWTTVLGQLGHKWRAPQIKSSLGDYHVYLAHSLQ